MNWPEAAFEELYADPSRNGVYKAKEEHGSGAKIVNMGELFAHDFVGPQEMARLAMSEVELEKSGLQDGDLLFGRRSLVEAGAGKCSIVLNISEPTTFESSIIRARLDQSRCEPLVYYYWFRSPQGRGRIRSIVSGTNVKGIRGSDLRRIRVILPKIDVQKQIASILKSYDNFIDNNRRRIGLLEEAARLLYREWFVHFRFPGHERSKIVDGVPEGWEVAPIKKSYCGLFDGPHATPTPSSDGPVFLGIANVRESGRLDLSEVKHVSESDFPKWTRRIMPEAGDIVFSYEATLNRYALIPRGLRCCLGRRMALIRPKADYRFFLYLHFFSADWRRIVAARIINGATVDRIPLTNFPEFPILLPCRKIAAAFKEIVEPQFNLIEVLAEQTEKLARARDLVLPRLMNGEIAL